MALTAVGVDCGASEARAVLLDGDGRTMLRHSGVPGAPATLTEIGLPVKAVTRVVRESLQRQALEPPVTSLWAGIAGAGRVEVRTRLEARFRAFALADRIRVSSDAEIAFHGAFGREPGILLIAGTGSIALARPAASPEVVIRVGGWGPAIDDRGSGYWIGKEALRETVRLADGRVRGSHHTHLPTGVLNHLRLVTPHELVSWREEATRRDVASLAPLVLQDHPDPASRRISRQAADYLAELVTTARARSGPWDGRAPLALVGGLMVKGGPLRYDLLERLSRERFRVVDAGDPAMGAAQLALAEAAVAGTKDEEHRP